MRMIAVLKNREHPEYGELSLPLPIKASEYDHTMDMLADLGIGDVLKRDCEIIELSRTFPILRQLEGCEVNIDELDYLAKRLESFEGDQDLQFEAAAVTKGITNIMLCQDRPLSRERGLLAPSIWQRKHRPPYILRMLPVRMQLMKL